MIMLIVIVLVVAMVLVTVNLGKVAIAKTSSANAADTAVLGLASGLGTMSRVMCSQIRSEGPNPGLCHKCHFGGYLGIVFGVIIIIVGIVLLFVFAPLGVAVILAGLGMILQTAVFDTLRIDSLNKRLRKGLPPMVSLRLQTYLTAMLPMIDDPHVQADTTDIDGDGDTSENVSTFAVWFDQKLDGYEAAVVAQAASQLPSWEGRLTTARNTVQELQDFLNNKLIPYFEWVEQEFDGRTLMVPQDPSDPMSPLIPVTRPVIDISFWQPGEQGRDMCIFGVPCPPLPPLCGLEGGEIVDEDAETVTPPAPPPGLDQCDQVDFMRSEAQEFIDFATGILSETPEERTGSLNEWVDAFRSAGAVQFEEWMEMVWGYPVDVNPPSIPGWEEKLAGLDAIISTALADPQLSIPPAPGGATLTSLMAELDGFMSTLQGIVSDLKDHNLTPVDVPVVDGDFIYSWQDKRGWHHVGAEVSNFKLPRPKVERTFAETCVIGKHAKGGVTVVVKRFDEDQHINRLWDMKSRNNPTDPSPNPADSASLDFGVRSEGMAVYGYKQHSVQLRSAK